MKEDIKPRLFYLCMDVLTGDIDTYEGELSYIYFSGDYFYLV